MCITKIRKPKQQTYPIQLQTVDQYQKINLKTIPTSPKQALPPPHTTVYPNTAAAATTNTTTNDHDAEKQGR